MHRKDQEFRLQQLNKEIPQQEGVVSQAQRRLSQLKKEQVEVTVSLNVVKDDITLSDHALVRYLERKYGFGFGQYREEVLTPIVIQAIKSGAHSIKVNGVSFKVKNNTIVTVT